MTKDRGEVVLPISLSTKTNEVDHWKKLENDPATITMTTTLQVVDRDETDDKREATMMTISILQQKLEEITPKDDESTVFLEVTEEGYQGTIHRIQIHPFGWT
jgi:hypothetical protein